MALFVACPPRVMKKNETSQTISCSINQVFPFDRSVQYVPNTHSLSTTEKTCERRYYFLLSLKKAQKLEILEGQILNLMGHEPKANTYCIVKMQNGTWIQSSRN